MEQKYWEQFTKSGEVSDYLGYKMEVYGHGGDNYGGTEAERYSAGNKVSSLQRNEGTGQGRTS